MGARIEGGVAAGTWFSLVELMVALAIGVSLSFGAMTLFLYSKRSQLQDQQLARLQENGRYALRYIAHELAMAGFRATLPAGAPVIARLAGQCLLQLPAGYIIRAWPYRRCGHQWHFRIDDRDITSRLPAVGQAPAGSDMLVSRRTADTATCARGS